MTRSAPRIELAALVWLAFALCAATAHAQDVGVIRGQVFDRESGVPVEGVTVTLEWPALPDGSAPRREIVATGADGEFELPAIASGSYDLRFARAGYRDSLMKNFEVVAGVANRADFPLPPISSEAGEEVLELDAFVVEASTVQDADLGLDMRLESDEMINTFSAEDFSKFSAGDVAEALERVVGVTIAEGQFAIIRGLDDRYNSTLYNGGIVPSPDPDKQSVQLDLFPSEAVSNLVVSKTFGPQLPSNSAGGAIDIITLDYPDELEFKIKAGTGFNTNAEDEFWDFDGRTNPERVTRGIDPEANFEYLRDEFGFRMIDGSPVGVQQSRTGDFWDDVGHVLEHDFVVSLGSTEEWEEREIRFKGVVSQEADYQTAKGFKQSLEPRLPTFGEGGLVFDPGCFCFMLVPGSLEGSGDLSIGELNLNAGVFDLTTSQWEKQQTAYAAFGFDLDKEGHHAIDASFFFTRKQDEIVQLAQNGFLPGVDYGDIALQQLDRNFNNENPTTPEFLPYATRTSSIARSMRQEFDGSPASGSLAWSSFAETTTFQRDRDLTIWQINGDHEFPEVPGLHFSWLTNWATTNQAEVSLGLQPFFEPCGNFERVPCPVGTDPVSPFGFFTPGTAPSGPPSVEALGPGAWIFDGRATMSANVIQEKSRHTRLDLDYEVEFTPHSTLLVAGGAWWERATRDVESSFLESPAVDTSAESCGGSLSQFFCQSPTLAGLGRLAFDEMPLVNGRIAGTRQVANESRREIDAYYLRGKWTLWERLDVLGGVRFEDIFIQSQNDPFQYDPETGEQLFRLGGPQIFPSRYVFFDRLDNPFSRIGADGIPTQETLTAPPDGTVFNDQILGLKIPLLQPCLGATTAADGELACVDYSTNQELAAVFTGEIDESRELPAFGLTLRPHCWEGATADLSEILCRILGGTTLRGAWSETVARPSFREMGYYVSVEPGSDDLVIGNPQLQLSDVESWDARAEFVWGPRGNLLAFGWFKKRIQNPIESIIVRDQANFETSSAALYRTFFNNPNTADLEGFEAEARISLDFLTNDGWLDVDGWKGIEGLDWLKWISIGANYTQIDASVGRSDIERARYDNFFAVKEGDPELFTEIAPIRRLFNQPEWIFNLDLTFDSPDTGTKLTLAYFAISDLLRAAGTAFLEPDGNVRSATLDRYVDGYDEWRLIASQDIPLPGDYGTITLKFAWKNIGNSTRRIVYDPNQTAARFTERAVKLGQDYDLAIVWTRTF